MAIERAIDTASARGGGVVYVPSGTYIVSWVSQSGAISCIVLKSNVSLIGEWVLVSIIKRAASQVTWEYVIANNGWTGNPDSMIVIQDIVIDGNGQNQSLGATDCQFGIGFYYAKFCQFTRVWVKNVFGTTYLGSSVGESFAFEAAGSNHFTYTCVAEGYANSSSGFSFDSGSNVFYNNCVAIGFGRGTGLRITMLEDILILWIIPEWEYRIQQ